jgi:methyl-accepting chemotaxis protein
VVASEVRSLAGRSAEAAREIKRLIQASVERVDSGTQLVQNAGATMGEIVASVHRVGRHRGRNLGRSGRAVRRHRPGEHCRQPARPDDPSRTPPWSNNRPLPRKACAKQAQRLTTAVQVFKLGHDASTPHTQIGLSPQR